MSKTIQLSKVAKYSKKRINASDVTLKNFITTDNILQNKAGITFATNLPPRETAMPAYEAGNILVGNIRPYLKKIWFANRNGGSSADVLVFDVNNGYDPKFVYYSLVRDDFFNHMMKGVKGTKMPRGDKNQILDFLISDFDFLTQKRIATVLSALDAKIELNQRINAELESMAKTLYDYWFVQFDFPNEKGKPYKSSGGKMVWNEVLKREIPLGWEAKKLIDFCFKIGDGIHGTPEYVEMSEYSFINGNNLKNGFIDIDDKTNKVSSEEYKKYFIELNDGTILLSINGTLGNLAVYTGEKVMLGKSAAYINCKEKNRSYCYQFLKLDYIQKKLWNIATGSTIKNLSLESLKNLLLPFPGDELLDQYYCLIKSVDDKRKNIFKETQTLTELRDWLLPMLMNGQVSVENS